MGGGGFNFRVVFPSTQKAPLLNTLTMLITMVVEMIKAMMIIDSEGDDDSTDGSNAADGAISKRVAAQGPLFRCFLMLQKPQENLPQTFKIIGRTRLRLYDWREAHVLLQRMLSNAKTS